MHILPLQDSDFEAEDDGDDNNDDDIQASSGSDSEEDEDVHETDGTFTPNLQICCRL